MNEAAALAIDINNGFLESLQKIKVDIVIHTSGPFQAQDYTVAKACIIQGCHYIDLADGRSFVENITSLDRLAKKQDVLIISGASTVPCLTSSLINHYQKDFSKITSLDYGITTAQKTARGLATTAAILGYTGKKFTTLVDGKPRKIYGWQDLYTYKFKNLGRRLLGNCDVPDLALFPKYYPDLKNIRFSAGLEIPFIHIILWLLSWLVRLKLIKSLEKYAPLLLRLSFLFDWLGTSNSAFYMKLRGKSKKGQDKTITFELTACSGDGPYIPSIPVILLARKLANIEISTRGAMSSIGLITRDEYLLALKDMDISWSEE